jgi:VWFA-related protein
MHKRLIPALSFAFAASAFAQSLTEKIDVSLVNVDVTVTSHGAPARGLTANDFEVLEDGVPQKITHFYTIENARDKAPAATPAPATAASAATQPDAGDERFRRRVLVIVDNRHINRHDRDVALAKLEQFMNEHFREGLYDWSLGMITDRGHLLVPLTSDKSRIEKSLITVRNAMAGRSVDDMPLMDDRIARRAPGSANDGEDLRWTGATIAGADRGAAAVNALVEEGNRFHEGSDLTRTYAAITELTRSFAALPGRKIVLLLTGEFGDAPNPLQFGGSFSAGRQSSAAAILRQRVVHDVNASNASIYIIATEGLKPVNLGADVAGGMGYTNALGGFGPGAATGGGAIYWLAHETGGQVFTGNRVDESLRDFNETSSNFYSLAYGPPHGEDGKYHQISVRVKRPGRYMLAYRSGYSSLPTGTQLQRAMASAAAVDMQRSTIPVTLAAGTANSANNSLTVPIFVKVPAKSLQFIPSGNEAVAMVEVFISVFDQDGRLIANFATAREAHAKTGTEAAGDFVEQDSVKLRRNGSYKVVAAIHDQTTDAVGIAATMLRE